MRKAYFNQGLSNRLFERPCFNTVNIWSTLKQCNWYRLAKHYVNEWMAIAKKIEVWLMETYGNTRSQVELVLEYKFTQHTNSMG